MISNYQKIKILLYSGTETSILDLRVVHGLAGRWQRSGNVFPPSITEYRHEDMLHFSQEGQFELVLK